MAVEGGPVGVDLVEDPLQGRVRHQVDDVHQGAGLTGPDLFGGLLRRRSKSAARSSSRVKIRIRPYGGAPGSSGLAGAPNSAAPASRRWQPSRGGIRGGASSRPSGPSHSGRGAPGHRPGRGRSTGRARRRRAGHRAGEGRRGPAAPRWPFAGYGASRPARSRPVSSRPTMRSRPVWSGSAVRSRPVVAGHGRPRATGRCCGCARSGPGPGVPLGLEPTSAPNQTSAAATMLSSGFPPDRGAARSAARRSGTRPRRSRPPPAACRATGPSVRARAAARADARRGQDHRHGLHQVQGRSARADW